MYFRALMRFLFKLTIIPFAIIFVFSGCNYHYHQGKKYEAEDRFEAANIEYHRAYTEEPDDDDFKDAYDRTAITTADDLLARYDKYLNEKKFHLAFRRLEQARVLQPDHERILAEIPRWHRVLIAGKVDFEFKTLKNQIPLADEMILEIQFNTPSARKLAAPIDNQTRTFNVEDVLYDPPQNLLMFYTINSIGVRLENRRLSAAPIQAGGMPASGSNRRFHGSRFQKFIDLRVPVLINFKGNLNLDSNGLIDVSNIYPINQLTESNPDRSIYPNRGVRFSLELEQNQINVNSESEFITFLPQMIYFNQEDRRIFLDFGHIHVTQKTVGGLWSFKRNIDPEREYLKDLKRNILLNPYFYTREGGFPFVKLQKG